MSGSTDSDRPVEERTTRHTNGTKMAKCSLDTLKVEYMGICVHQEEAKKSPNAPITLKVESRTEVPAATWERAEGTPVAPRSAVNTPQKKKKTYMVRPSTKTGYSVSPRRRAEQGMPM